MAKNNLREIAKLLYLQGIKQKEIAEKLGVTENTVSRWVKEGVWDTLKKNLLNSKAERLRELYDELEETNRMIREKEGYKVANAKEADARRKLIADIAQLESKYNVAQTTTIARDFVQFVADIDYEESKRILSYFDAFIEQQIAKQKWQE